MAAFHAVYTQETRTKSLHLLLPFTVPCHRRKVPGQGGNRYVQMASAERTSMRKSLHEV